MNENNCDMKRKRNKLLQTLIDVCIQYLVKTVNYLQKLQ